jgi:hypothetical protein
MKNGFKKHDPIFIGTTPVFLITKECHGLKRCQRGCNLVELKKVRKLSEKSYNSHRIAAQINVIC